MSDNLGLQIGFSANEGNILAVFDKISNANKKLVDDTKKAHSEVDNLGTKFENLGRTIVHAFEALAVLEVLNKFNEVAEGITKVTDRAKALGVSAESLEQLGFAAKLSGQDIGTVEDSLGKFSVKVGELLQGNKAVEESFKQVGLSASDLRGKSLTAQYEQVAIATQKISDKNLQAAAALPIFGRSFQSALALARDGLEKNIALYDKLNIGLTDEQRNATKTFTDSEKILGSIYDGLKEKIVANVSGPLAEMTNQLIDFIQKSGGIDKIAEDVGHKIVDIIKATIDTFNALKPGFVFLLDTLKTLVNTAQGIFSSAKFTANTFSDNLSQGSTAAHRSKPSFGDFLYDNYSLGKGGSVGQSVSNFIHPFDVAPQEFNDYDPNKGNKPANKFDPRVGITGASYIASIPNFKNNTPTGSTTNPYDDVTAKIAGIAVSSDKATKALETFGTGITKSGDLITAAFKSLDGKDIGDAINRIFGIINSKGVKSQADYDAETKTGLEKYLAQGGTNTDQYNLNRQLSRPNDPVSTTSADFDKAAAQLIQNLKDGLSGQAFNSSIHNLALQSQVDLQSGTGSADQKVIEEITKFATSLGANKQQVQVGITVTPTKDFTIKWATDQDTQGVFLDLVNSYVANSARLGAKS
jgi:hypothetical protein